MAVDEVKTRQSLTVEMETLKSIYVDELQLEDTSSKIDEGGDSLSSAKLSPALSQFSVNLLPSTAENKTEQFVKLSLRLQIPEKYPEEPPVLEICNARGLSEHTIEVMKSDLKKLVAERIGSNMLYEIIDSAKEFLTKHNFPTCQCTICLYEFSPDDSFVKTDCFHHFHSRCLVQYIASEEAKKATELADKKELEAVSMDRSTKEESDEVAQNSMPCPVCRVETNLKDLVGNDLEQYPIPSLSKNPIDGESTILSQAKHQQEKFADLFEKQKLQGGIIDKEEEENKFLIRISESAAKELDGTSSATKHESSDKPVSSVNGEGDSSNDARVKQDTVESSSLPPTQTADVEIQEKPIEFSEAQDISDKSSRSNQTENEPTPSTPPECPDRDDTQPKLIDVSIKDATSDEEVKAKNLESSKENLPSQEADHEAAKPKKSSRRRRNRSRTKSGQTNHLLPKSEGEGASDEPQMNNNPRQSRPYNRRGPRSEHYYNGRGRGGRGNFNGGMNSPPFKRNFGNGWTQSEDGNNQPHGRQRQDSNEYYHGARNDSRDRPGYFAPRVFRRVSRGQKEDSNSQQRQDEAADGGVSTEVTVYNAPYANTGGTNNKSNVSENTKRRGGGRFGNRNRYSSETEYSHGPGPSEVGVSHTGSENASIAQDLPLAPGGSKKSLNTQNASRPRQSNSYGYSNYDYYHRPRNNYNPRYGGGGNGGYYSMHNGGYYPGYYYDDYDYDGRQGGYASNYYNYYGYRGNGGRSGYGGYNSRRGGRNRNRNRPRRDSAQSQSNGTQPKGDKSAGVQNANGKEASSEKGENGVVVEALPLRSTEAQIEPSPSEP